MGSGMNAITSSDVEMIRAYERRRFEIRERWGETRAGISKAITKGRGKVDDGDGQIVLCTALL